ncbi:hypothetical protein Cni_G13464 [Canna indica]|uniref:Dof zinc finger protein n=1 Tax=Canna indica TaxID=4628 RepID=A0AAQ3KE19_9LILI|nr:hypothetical protein Cni_G13464 [Canna indica]
MVFPSVPLYLDTPNWNQQQQVHHQQGSVGGGGGSGETSELPLGIMAAPRPEGGMAGGSIRPGSMADRARLSKIPQPEPGLKCPRCDSTNTKFCYFNNYSLSQPRHFCKMCRRYWTRGGALRNVPVGGGCRRNKRTKSCGGSSSKSSTTMTAQTAGGGGGGGGASSSSFTATSSGVGGAIASHLPLPSSQLQFMASLHPLPDFAVGNFGMSFSSMQPVDAAEYQLGNGSSGVSIGLENLRLQQQQMQQIPLLGGLELPQTQAPVSGLYPCVGEGSGFLGGLFTGQAQPKQSNSMKMEADNQQLLNFPRQYLGASRNDQFWSGGGGGSGGWATDLSGFNS